MDAVKRASLNMSKKQFPDKGRKGVGVGEAYVD